MENGISNVAANLSLILKDESSESEPTSSDETSSTASVPQTIEDTVNLSSEALLEAARSKISQSIDENGTRSISIDGEEISGNTLKATASELEFGQPFARPDADIVDISGDNNSVKTRGGNDLTIINGDENIIDAGDGDDEVFITGSSNNIDLGSGNDTLNVVGDDNTISESNDNDNIIINGNDNILRTGKGDDTVIASSDQSVILSGNGNDNIEIVGDANTISTSIGDDTLKATGDQSNLFTGAGNDTIEVSGDENLILTGAGNDTIKSSGQNNAIFSGSGDDTITIQSSPAAATTDSTEVVASNEIEDDDESYTEVFAGSGNDTINLEDTSGVFNIEGGSGTNTLNLGNLSLESISEASLEGKTLELSNGDGLEINIRDIGTIQLSDGQSYSAEELVSAVESNNSSTDSDSVELPIEENILIAQDNSINRALNRLLTPETEGNQSTLDIVG